MTSSANCLTSKKFTWWHQWSLCKSADSCAKTLRDCSFKVVHWHSTLQYKQENTSFTLDLISRARDTLMWSLHFQSWDIPCGSWPFCQRPNPQSCGLFLWSTLVVYHSGLFLWSIHVHSYSGVMLDLHENSCGTKIRPTLFKAPLIKQ